MTKQLTTMIAVLALAGTVSAQTKKAEGLTGTWNMGLQGGHVIPVALVLTQEGETLTGVVSMPTQKIGQTVEGAKDPTTIEITGKLNDEGMLEGRVVMSGTSGPHGDMPYTAERLKERK